MIQITIPVNDENLKRIDAYRKTFDPPLTRTKALSALAHEALDRLGEEVSS